VGFHQGTVWFVTMSVLSVVWFQVKPSSSIWAWVPVGLFWVDQRSIVPARVMVMMIMIVMAIAFFVLVVFILLFLVCFVFMCYVLWWFVCFGWW
jgi:hypothetical protein